MIFLAETDEKQYKSNLASMAKFEKVKHISDLVTISGKVELTQDQVREIQNVLAPKVQKTALITEKSTMLLHENFKRLGLDMAAISKTAANIQDTF